MDPSMNVHRQLLKLYKKSARVRDYGINGFNNDGRLPEKHKKELSVTKPKVRPTNDPVPIKPRELLDLLALPSEFRDGVSRYIYPLLGADKKASKSKLPMGKNKSYKFPDSLKDKKIEIINPINEQDYLLTDVINDVREDFNSKQEKVMSEVELILQKINEEYDDADEKRSMLADVLESAKEALDELDKLESKEIDTINSNARYMISKNNALVEAESSIADVSDDLQNHSYDKDDENLFENLDQLLRTGQISQDMYNRYIIQYMKTHSPADVAKMLR